MSDDTTTFHYPHFLQDHLTDLAFSFNTGNVRRALSIQWGEQEVSMNAHDACKFLAWLQEHGARLQAMSQELNQLAIEEDLSDQARIEREWQAYRNEGLGSAG